jgi:hypothetical protein
MNVPWFLYVIVIAPFPVVFGLSLLIRRLTPSLSDSDPAPLSGVFSYVTSAFSFIIGLSIVFLLGEFEDARSAVGDEATSIGTAFEVIELFPESRQDVQHALICYAKAVTEFEWEALNEGTTSPEVDAAYTGIISALGMSEAPHTKQFQTAASTNIFVQVGNISTARETRIVASRIKLSFVLWTFIFGSALLIVALAFLTTAGATPWSQALLVGFVAALTGLMITIVLSLSQPFSGPKAGLMHELIGETLEYMQAQLPDVERKPCAFESTN